MENTQKTNSLNQSRSKPKPTYSFNNSIHSLQIHHFLSHSPLSPTPTTQYGNALVRKSGSDNKKSFKNSTLRGFGCTEPPEVTVPAVITSAAHWEEKREKKRTKRKKKKGQQQQLLSALWDDSNGFGSVGVQDLWCGPGIGGFGADAVANCVVSARPIPGRGKIDVNKVHHREDQDAALENPNLGWI